jgi:uncharacterized protein (TIGR02231 family)
MRIPSAMLCFVVLAAPAAAQTDVTSAIDAVTVYPDGATVTRIIHVDLPQGGSVLRARDFPPGLDPASLRVEGDGRARLVIGSIDARPPRADRPPLDPALENRIEALRDERGGLDDKIEAATARRAFAQRFAESSPVGLGDKGEARPIAEWRSAFVAVAEEVAAADGAIREARLRQREIDRELARLEARRNADPPRKMEVRIDLAADAATAATLRISYSVRGARWSPIYDARLDSGARDRKPSLELVRRAEIVQNTGEDWQDVQLAVSTVRTAKGGSAPDLRPLIVRYPVPRPPAPERPQPMPAAPPAAALRSVMPEGAAGASAAQMADMKLARSMAAEEREATVDTGGFQAVFRLPARVSIAADEGAKSFRIGAATIAPDLLVRAAPALDSTGFLEAGFKHGEDAPLLPGRVAIYRDGIFVGRGQMALTAREQQVRLGFGADDRVKIERTIVSRTEGSAGLIATSKTDQRDYKTTVRNGHDAAVRIAIEDQLPVGEIDDVKVELLPGSTAPTERDVRNRRGVVAWSFELGPGEARDIKFGWRVRWPSDKAIVYAPGP